MFKRTKEHLINVLSEFPKNIDSDKTLINFLMSKDFDDFNEKTDCFTFISQNQKTFNKSKYSIRRNKNNLFLTAIKNSIITNNITFPILKLNTIIDLLFINKCSLLNELLTTYNAISTKQTIPRKSVLLRIINNNDYTLNNRDIEDIEVGDRIKLHPFQVKQLPNMNNTIEMEYIVKSKDALKQHDYLYFIQENFIFRIKPILKITLNDNKLEYKDFLYNCWATNKEQTDNAIIYYHVELIMINKNKELSKLVLNSDTTTHSINNVMFDNNWNKNKCYYPSSKLIKLLNQKKISVEEIDNIFNPKQTIQSKQNITNDITITIYEDSSGDSDNSEEDNTEIEAKPKEINNFIYTYNKHYTFEKDIIEHSINCLYESNIKFKKLLNDYEIIHIIKPISKTYTNQKYFNFILTDKTKSIISTQYHSYLNDSNEIISLTKIDNILI
jgi:hypothetical protein